MLLASENFRSPNVLKVYFFHASSVLHFARNFENFPSLKFVKSSKSMLKVYFSEVLKKYTSQKHERSTKKVYFLVLLASENFPSPNVLKVYFFHASSVLNFTRNFENFQLLKFVKSARSMIKYEKRLVLRHIHHFIPDLVNNMDHMRISGTLQHQNFFMKVQKYLKCAFSMLLVICILRKT